MSLPTPGEEREFLAIDHLRVVANWDTWSPRSERNVAQMSPPTGWVVLETRVWIHSSNNGSRSTRVLAGGARIESLEEVKRFYQQQIDAAYKDGKRDLAAKLKHTQEEHEKYYRQFYTSHNLIEATVSARAWGSVVDRKRGWEEISVYAKCMYLGIPSTQSLTFQSQLERFPLGSDLREYAVGPIFRGNEADPVIVGKLPAPASL